MFYEPSAGHGLPHDPFKAIVAPRPIGWISTVAADGSLNLAPYSFFNALGTNPHLVMFSSEGAKDSATYASETGEFVVNLVTRDLVDRMNASSIDAPRGVSEFGHAGLTPVPSRLVKPPRVGEAHAALECKVTEIVRPKGLDGRTETASPSSARWWASISTRRCSTRTACSTSSGPAPSPASATWTMPR